MFSFSVTGTPSSGSAVPAATQVSGGEQECDYNFVIDDWFFSGTIPIFFWHVEVTCVTVIDEEAA